MNWHEIQDWILSIAICLGALAIIVIVLGLVGMIVSNYLTGPVEIQLPTI